MANLQGLQLAEVDDMNQTHTSTDLAHLMCLTLETFTTQLMPQIVNHTMQL